ncbi:ATP-binding cassette domain-containing protein [Vibrio sp.]|uniref:ATP-binding cassette domain-containing protein n=1 Tax=Vibrio sp. TaxID=678 RepID=UPI003D0BD826
MPVLQIHQLSYQFSDGETLFAPVTISLQHSRIGLIGRNGSGKSVLASLIGGQKPSCLGTVSGHVTLTAPCRLFEQNIDLEQLSDCSIARLLGMEATLEALDRIEQGDCAPHWFDLVGDQWQLKSQLFELLQKLRIPKDYNLLCSQLSGGQLTCLRLWQLFQSDARLLILDEPSNHLDAVARNWLQQQMDQFSGAIILISHDRQLLNQVEQIWSLSRQGLEVYSGGYDQYLLQSTLQNEALDRKIQHLSKAQLALARQVQKDREKASQREAHGNRIRRKGSQPKLLLDGKRDRATANVSQQNKNVNQRGRFLSQQKAELQSRQQIIDPLSMALHQGVGKPRPLLRLNNLVLPFCHQPPISLMLRSQQKLHLAGNNGSGKSTLLRLVADHGNTGHGAIPVRGTIAVNCDSLYLDQNFSLVKTERSLLDNLLLYCPHLSQTEARTCLAGIGFRRDKVHLTATHLSGGEKMKLAVLIVSHRQHETLLLLDEPDNHLDIDARRMLAGALATYNGSVILVSHDAEFVKECQIDTVYRLG